ncbi:MAG TPA: undecaprenyl-diphosphate phosphatase [Candidatus Moranbacteria bacterium]|nr:undecaprenyl-diphosphate phosphatase [Candidatus Moranbacteria bacterium]
MDVFQSIILGVVQGLGEFLPISSTAHLILAPYFFGWSDPGLSFDVALHVGTLIAVVAFFWRDWITILKLALQEISNFEFQISNSEEYPSQLVWLLIAASVPGAIFGFFLDDYAEQMLRHPLIIAFTLSVVGLILFLVDKFANHKKEIKNMSFKDAILIGLSQAVAIIPGVSRSGATMTTGLALGLSREQAARFSFLLSTPIIFGAAIFKIPELLKTGITLPIVLGILAAAVSGYLAIKYMLRFIQKVGYAPFFWYRLALALIIVIVYFIK